ncbi:MFS transporter [Candidatus Woesearchaeota archaeon]|nr:MFS transporter [Candidatus Woesearchaeota archaeon]
MLEHHNFMQFFRNEKLNELYSSMAIRSFALSMITIFIPIYLLSVGCALKEIFIFYIILNISHALATIPAGFISSRYGFKHSIAASTPVVIVFYLMLYSLEGFGWPLYVVAILAGVNDGLFWVGYHTDFSIFSTKRVRGRELGILQTLVSLSNVAGPFIGGIMLAIFGFKFMFAVVSILLFISTIPLFFSDDNHQKMPLRFYEIFKGRSFRDYLALMGKGLQSRAHKIIWPIFIFMNVFGNFTGVGLVTSISLCFSLIIPYLSGKVSDMRRRLVLRLSSVADSFVWFIRLFVSTPLHVFVIDSVYGMTNTTSIISFNALNYDKANMQKTKALESIIFREIMIQAGGCSFFVIMLLISGLATGFVLGSIGSLLQVLF